MKPVCGCDIGPENPCIARYENGVFSDSRRSIHITGDGRIFDWEESQLVQLVIQWLLSHKKYWEGCEFIYIEGQFSVRKGKERACLLMRNAVETFFTLLYLRGEGPKPISESPKWWKDRVGVEWGGHLNKDASHAENKKRALEVYLKHPEGGIEQVKLLHERYGSEIYDPVEARLMCLALKSSTHELRGRGDKFYSKHKQQGEKKRFKEEERWLPLYTQPEEDPMLLVPQYMTVKKQKRKKESTKLGKKLLKYV